MTEIQLLKQWPFFMLWETAFIVKLCGIDIKIFEYRKLI